jgi:hypothetical protein
MRELQALDHTDALAKSTVGTPYYMSPGHIGNPLTFQDNKFTHIL